MKFIIIISFIGFAALSLVVAAMIETIKRGRP